MKKRSSVRTANGCEYCKIIKRKGVVRMICSRNPKHRTKQG